MSIVLSCSGITFFLLLDIACHFKGCAQRLRYAQLLNS
jgi:hypothetical protein